MRIYAAISMFFLALTAGAQINSYSFVKEGGQISYLDPNDSGVRTHTVADDIVLPAKVKIGFSFKFNGNFYDSVGISENGWIWFGPAQPAEISGIVNPITSTLPAGVKGVVCAFGVDLHPHVTTSLTTTIRTKTVMFAGQPDDFIVEWRNTSRIDALNDVDGEDTIGFQIQLFHFELDRIQITYAYDIGLNPNVSSDLSVGIKGENNNDFKLRMTDATHSWNNTAEANSVNNTCAFNISNNPGKVSYNYMSWLNNNPGAGLGETDGTGKLKLYPVPAQDRLFFETSEKIEAFQLCSMDGRILISETWTGTGILVSELLPGIYVLKVQTAKGVVATTFIKS